MIRTALRRGDIVQVKSAEEILRTLDDRAELEKLPFMAEMLQYCGKQFSVEARAERICDTSHHTGGRKLPGAVFLEDLRCDGSAHDGCQAECRLFWKEDWLRRVGQDDGSSAVDQGSESGGRLRSLCDENSRSEVDADDGVKQVFRCQATQVHYASKHLRWFDPRPYVNELLSGNVGFWKFLEVTARAVYVETRRKLGLHRREPFRSTRVKSPPSELLNLEVGEQVCVRKPNEIAATLTSNGTNRGLWFDAEMLPFCEQSSQIRQRVRKLIDERNGEMIEIASDCLTLEGVACSGEHSPLRWFCHRAIIPYWRECWLRRAA
jgi:hypothetical protein